MKSPTTSFPEASLLKPALRLLDAERPWVGLTKTSRVILSALFSSEAAASLSPEIPLQEIAAAMRKHYDAVDKVYETAENPLPPQAVADALGCRFAVLLRRAGRPSPKPPWRVAASPLATAAAQEIVCTEWSRFLTRLYGLATPWDAEYVHEARVALRRLRAALRVFRQDLPTLSKTMRTQLHDLATALGVIRDTDVFLEFLRKYGKTAPKTHVKFLDGLEASIVRKRQRSLQAALALLDSAECRDFFNAFNCWSSQSFPGLRRLKFTAPLVLQTRLATTWSFPEDLMTCSPEQLHLLRIACKKARYAAEFFAAYCEGPYAAEAARMERMQDQLGQVHDADVFATGIDAYFHRSHATGQTAYRAITRHLAESRLKVLEEVAREWKNAHEEVRPEMFKANLILTRGKWS